MWLRAFSEARISSGVSEHVIVINGIKMWNSTCGEWDWEQGGEWSSADDVIWNCAKWVSESVTLVSYLGEKQPKTNPDINFDKWSVFSTKFWPVVKLVSVTDLGRDAARVGGLLQQNTKILT